MNERNWEYKGLQLSNSSNPYNFQVDDVANEIVYESKIFSNTNTDGVYSSNVTTGARYFEFTGRIYGTKTERELWYQKLKEAIKSEDFPSIVNRGFHTLKWSDKRGQDVQIQAKVYKALSTKEARHNMLEFSFTLLADQPLYQSQTENTETGGLGRLWGNTLGNTLPNTLDQGLGGIIIDHQWDKKAPIYIKALWSLSNPRATNITTWQSLKILTSTTILEIDNRSKPFKITEDGSNIKSTKRWEFIYLAPGENKIIISAEGGDQDVEVTIKYRDTFE